MSIGWFLSRLASALVGWEIFSGECVCRTVLFVRTPFNARSRQEAMEKGLTLLIAGNNRDAFRMFQQAVEITPTVAHELFEVETKSIYTFEDGRTLRFVFFQAFSSQGHECIVAPFEADSQLAYMSVSYSSFNVLYPDSSNHVYNLKSTGYVQGVVTIDSDLVIHGCERVSYHNLS